MDTLPRRAWRDGSACRGGDSATILYTQQCPFHPTDWRTMGTIVQVVFDLESVPPEPLGTYTGTEEDSILYRDPYGFRKIAPADCVKIVAVELFPKVTA